MQFEGDFQFDIASADRMLEANILGMEHQSFIGNAIQFIAHNGAVQPFGMCSMHTQLVGAPGQWKEMHMCTPASFICKLGNNPVFCNGTLARYLIDPLTRSVLVVGR